MEGVVFTMYDARTKPVSAGSGNVKENLNQNIYKQLFHVM